MTESSLHRDARYHQLRLEAGILIGMVLLLRLAGPPGVRPHAMEFTRGFLFALVALVGSTWLCVHAA